MTGLMSIDVGEYYRPRALAAALVHCAGEVER